MKKVLTFLLGTILIFLVLFGLYQLLALIFTSVDKLNPNVIASIIAALTAVFGYLYNQFQTKNRDIQEIHRSKKVEIYNDFMELMFKILDQENKERFKKLSTGKLPRDIEVMFNKFHKDLITWGSPDVIKKYITFRDNSNQTEGNNILVVVNDLLLAIRKDLGNSNFNLRDGELLKIFINDSEKIDELLK